MKLFVNLFCHDIAQQLRFYQALLGLEEATHSRSPIYCALASPTFQFGFHAPPAYGLLSLSDRAPASNAKGAVTTYATFMLDSAAAVSEATTRVQALGGRVIKGPYATYYREWQAVVSDPEDHVFRLSASELPAGVTAPSLQLPQ
ncbi:VOC family protein [Hydrogenophaga sp.]|uniref:VOC family protein n=1 Tax=Hydrogenophaga sp. TaxID=1904254 RepID=UPI002718B485|nr:VOC family protein [Hydrogenophaga sp.]MDO8903370.1 VOC family protein [Hydrogenophaga sp.]